MSQSILFATRLIPCLILCVPAAQAALRTLEGTQGGIIVYGQVEGVSSQVGAMGSVLRSVHNQCGERPIVGKPFQVRGTRSVAVFFTVTKRTQGNKAVAGMVIATEGAPGQIEAALVTDDAARFGTTVNPMLSQLFGVWHPGGEATPASTSTPQGRAAPMHMVVVRDQSASVGVPEGWHLDPESSGGTVGVIGPQGQTAYFNLTRQAIDPGDPQIRSLARSGIRPQTNGKIVSSVNVSPVKSFSDRLQQFYRLNGVHLNAANCQIDNVEQVPTPRNQTCVHATGHLDLDGKGMKEMEMLMTANTYSGGNYLIGIFMTLCPKAIADRERATMKAVFGTYQMNQGVVSQQAYAYAKPAIDRIHAIGAAAKARSDETNTANESQHQAWNAQQESQARTNAGFHNYLLDQTVIQDNNHNAHGTVWNSTADALVRHNPDRFELVQAPNFWKGIDY